MVASGWSQTRLTPEEAEEKVRKTIKEGIPPRLPFLKREMKQKGKKAVPDVYGNIKLKCSKGEEQKQGGTKEEEILKKIAATGKTSAPVKAIAYPSLDSSIRTKSVKKAVI